MSTLAVNTITAETGNTVSLASGKTLDASQGLTTPAGHAVQQTVGSSTTTFSTTSTSFTNTNLSASITPKYSNSIIFGSLTGFVLIGGESAAEGQYQISANGTPIFTDIWSLGQSTSHALFLPCSMTWHHSPNTTSAVTYRLTARSIDGTVSVYFYRQQYMQLTEMKV